MRINVNYIELEKNKEQRMYEHNTIEQQQTRSVSCKHLPEDLIDKQAAKLFFGKFGAIKAFILRPKRHECTVEFETFESAQLALNFQGNFLVFPTAKPEAAESDFIDPDVQSELDLMQPVGVRSQPKQGMESFMRTSQTSLMKPRTQAATRPLAVTVSSSVDPRLVSSARNELEIMCKKPARSAEEKLQVLDARDKLYRLINARTTDINQVSSTKGTCKDMCPEKERLMREARLQVASFEVSSHDGSSMDQRKAIKQYSRSAADAETPLPHELRPETSLRTTMTYLLHNIIDLCDDDNTSIGDWFHFVWDRTRGIRKDITQQDICSLVTVELVEQCVRFHIHCSSRLIAEDPSTFDQKINTENLTKCLQTLKYMYNDLKVKNVKCPNEAEFRAYVVLLNLNESGNFLWEIKQLEKSILNSTEVRFALDVYFAVANNNYVKFFNLVREASYMSACLLMRYFTQVRIKAITIIMRSYTPRKVGFNYSISYLTDILAFEDFDTTIGFLTHHGLMCDPEADLVLLDRSTFTSGDTPYPMERSYQLVDSKMDSSVAQAVCGGSLPSPDCFLNLVPHSSFDKDGFLRRESFYAEDQNGPSPNIAKENVFKIPKGSPPVSPMSQLRPQKNDQLDGTETFHKSPATIFSSSKPSMAQNIFKATSKPEAKKSTNPFGLAQPIGSQQNQTTANSIFGSFAQSKPVQKQPTAPSPFSFSSSSTAVEPKAPASIFGGTSGNKDFFSFAKPEEQSRPLLGQIKSPGQQARELQEKREKIIAEKIKLEEEIKLKEMHEQRLRAERELKAKQERERLEAEEARKQEEQRRLEEIVKQQRAQQQACEMILDSLVDEIVEEEVKRKAQHSIELFVKIPEEFYEAVEFDVVVNQVHKIYNQEFLAYVNQTKMKYEMMQSCFKKWRKTTKEEIQRREKLSTIGCSILNSSLEQQADSLHHPEQSETLKNMKQYLKGSPQIIKLPDIDNFPKINLFDELKMKPVGVNANLFWKLLVSIPWKNQEKSPGFSAFINKWLINTLGEEANKEEVFFIKEKIVKSSKQKLGICIRKLQGIELLDEQGKHSNVVQNSQGILFFATSSDLQASRRRLQTILDKLELPVPVSLIVYKNQVEDKDEDELRRYFDLSMEVNVATFEINLFYECHGKEKNLAQVVLDSFQFLNICFVDELQRKHLKLFDLQMQNILDFFQITIGDEMWQRIEISRSQCESFKKHMRSFNRVVELYNKCLDKLMQMVTNDFKKLPSLSEEFRRKLVPMDRRIPLSYEYFPNDWKLNQHQQRQISFIHSLKLVTMQDDSFRSFDDFRCKLMTFLSSNMISNTEKVFQAVVAKVIDHLYSHGMIETDDVNEALESYCWLSVLSEIVVGKFNGVYQKNQQVAKEIIYFKKDLQNYKTVPWWFTIEFRTTEHEQPAKKKPKLTLPTSQDIEVMLTKSVSSLSKISKTINTFKEVSSKTREESKDFDQHLMRIERNLRGKLSEWEEEFKD